MLKIICIFAVLINNTYSIANENINLKTVGEERKFPPMGVIYKHLSNPAVISIMENKICGIYKITSPSKKVYIGQSIDIENRLNEYRLLRCKKQPRLYSSLKKHGWDKHKKEIIHQCQYEQLNELEKYYVDLFQSFNTKYGLNLRDGGGSKGIPSLETRKKMSLSAKNMTDEKRKKLSDGKMGNKNPMFGKKLSDEHKKSLSISNLGKKMTDYQKQILIQSRTGTHHTEESKTKMREAMVGRKASEETKAKISQNSAKWNLGKKLSEKTKELISQNVRKAMTPEVRKKISDAQMGEKNNNFGKPNWNSGKKGCFSQETLKKLSESHSGERHPMFGKHHSEETKIKMRMLKIGKKQTEEHIKKVKDAKMANKIKRENEYGTTKFISKI